MKEALLSESIGKIASLRLVENILINICVDSCRERQFKAISEARISLFLCSMILQFYFQNEVVLFAQFEVQGTGSCLLCSKEMKPSFHGKCLLNIHLIPSKPLFTQITANNSVTFCKKKKKNDDLNKIKHYILMHSYSHAYLSDTFLSQC